MEPPLYPNMARGFAVFVAMSCAAVACQHIGLGSLTHVFGVIGMFALVWSNFP